jgi:hypothetical protein
VRISGVGIVNTFGQIIIKNSSLKESITITSYGLSGKKTKTIALKKIELVKGEFEVPSFIEKDVPRKIESAISKVYSPKIVILKPEIQIATPTLTQIENPIL